MPNFLNTVNNLNPVDFSFRGNSNFGLQKRQSLIKAKSSSSINERSEMNSKARENNLKFQNKDTNSTKQKTESSDRTESSSDREDFKRDAKSIEKSKSEEVKDRVLEKKDTKVNKTESEQDFKKTLAKESETSETEKKPLIEKIDKKDLEEGVESLIQALVSMVQELNDKPEIEIDLDTTNTDLDTALDLNVDLDLEVNKNIDVDLNENVVDIETKFDTGGAVSQLLSQFAEEINIDNDNIESEQLLEIVNQFINNAAFADLDMNEKLDLSQELNSILSEKLDTLKDKINDAIRSINLESLSLKDINLDDDNDVKIDDDVHAKLESIINLGEKSEALDSLKKMSEKIAKTLETLDKRLDKMTKNPVQLTESHKETVMKILEPKLDKLLSKYNAEIIEDPSLNPSTNKAEDIIGLGSFDLEDLGQDSSSSSKQGNESPVSLLTKDIKMILKGDKASSINTRMKASEFVKSLPEMVKETPANSTKELKIKLNPEELGTVEVSITKNANQQLSIQLTVSNDNADKVLRQRIIELTASLTEKGVSVENINVSKSENSEANAQGQNQEGQNSFNEASEEQKRQQNNSSQKQREDEVRHTRSFQNELLGILRK